jgi:hypothetical protein
MKKDPMCTSILQSVCFAALLQTCMAWLPAFSPSHSINRANLRRNVRPTSHLAVSRRGYFAEATLLSSAIVASFNVPSISSDLVAHASTPLADGNAFADKHFSVEDAKQRFQAARKDLRYLVENYSDISKGGGDAVRNYLGTQGVNSNLYGIQRVLKILRDEASDIVEYTEAMDEFNAYYYQAEGAAYQSLFVEHSSAKGTPESFLKTAKQDLDQMEKYMDLVAAQLGN